MSQGVPRFGDCEAPWRRPLANAFVAGSPRPFCWCCRNPAARKAFLFPKYSSFRACPHPLRKFMFVGIKSAVPPLYYRVPHTGIGSVRDGSNAAPLVNSNSPFAQRPARLRSQNFHAAAMVNAA